MNKFLQAKGRLKVGEMNRTEAAYRDYLEQQKNAGLILKYWFERFTWKIASNRCSYTPDFWSCVRIDLLNSTRSKVP